MIESQLPNIEYYQYLVVNYVDIYQLIMRKDAFKVLKGVIDARKVLKEKPDLLFSKEDLFQYP